MSPFRLSFSVEATAAGTAARAGRLQTRRGGEILTPIFMPVGTNATVKSQRLETLNGSGSKILLANTYHLLLRPGPEVFRRLGGIHKFMKWSGSVLTDSGGFQIFSLPERRKITEEGAAFQSHIDGSTVRLTPEASIETQAAIDSDIMMALDVCVPSVCDRPTAEEALERTFRWARRSLDARRPESSQALFGIVQGACFEDLRRRSADQITSLEFDGFAIGGLAVGETKSEREDFAELTASLLPHEKPRYLMGVGTPIDLLEAVHRGVDMFDCILPTALAQQGVAYTSRGRLRINRSVYKFSEEPLDPDCPCPVCTTHTRGYLHHLTKAGEVLGWSLIGEHNLYFYHRLMASMRTAIVENRFAALYKELRVRLSEDDVDNPVPAMPPPRVRKIPRRGDYEIVENAAGHSVVRQLSSGEAMHSVNDPSVEARSLYLDQSRLVERLGETNERPLVVWDVGLGAGANALVSLRAAEQLEQNGVLKRPLEIISFERDLDPMHLACAHRKRFAWLHHGAPDDLLAHGLWTSKLGGLRWRLLEGDFLARMAEAPAPDVIFYDPFSAKTDGPLWTRATFARVFAAVSPEGADLFTYSASTAVRAALLASGFWVAEGAASGPKAATTAAFTKPALARRSDVKLLDRTWLERWERSSARWPKGEDEAALAEAEAILREHPQWSAL